MPEITQNSLKKGYSTYLLSGHILFKFITTVKLDFAKYSTKTEQVFVIYNTCCHNSRLFFLSKSVFHSWPIQIYHLNSPTQFIQTRWHIEKESNHYKLSVIFQITVTWLNLHSLCCSNISTMFWRRAASWLLLSCSFALLVTDACKIELLPQGTPSIDIPRLLLPVFYE